jgi:hypothetical protein
MALTRQELILQFMMALASSGTAQFNKESVNNVYVLAAALADRYLESL